MAYRKISHDVKLAAIRLYERRLLRLQEILDCCSISKRTWFRILKLWRETGDVVNHPTGIRARARQLDHEDLDYLLQLICSNPDYFLDELVTLLRTNRFISIHFKTVFAELQRAGVSYKKLKRIAIEHDEGRCAEFIARMAQYDASEIGFIDEVSKDERTIGRRYGRSQKGIQAVKKQPFIRGRRFTMDALLTLEGISAATVVEGAMTKALFLQWLEYTIVCTCSICIWPTYSPFSSCQSVLRILAHSVSS